MSCNVSKSDDELTRKDLLDIIEIYKKRVQKFEIFIESIKKTISFDHDTVKDAKYDLDRDIKELEK